MSNTMVRTLANGLQVILREVHTAPVISFWVAYRIGSRNEPTGKTGISHWVEHMMFKGTEQFPAGTLDKEIDRRGGQWNAMTSQDFTMYYQTLPSDRINIALESEADRMVNAIFDPEETESERTVIISERQGSENHPVFWLREEVSAAAFRVHGYHHSIIGDLTDLQTMTRDDLFEHYKQHYTPSNATVIAVGDFDSDEMLAKIEDLFGTIPAQTAPNLFSRPEPKQNGERRVQVERPGNNAFLQMVYRIPPATHDDWFHMEILDSILTGPGGGTDNKTSRLYQSLVKSDVAASVSGWLQESIDPYVYTLMVMLRDGKSPEEAEGMIQQEIERIQQDGIQQAELDKAKKQARASFAFATESISNQAYYLARSAILGDPNWFDQYLSRLDDVTVEGIQTVANQYLTPQNRTVGHLIPTGMEMSE